MSEDIITRTYRLIIKVKNNYIKSLKEEAKSHKAKLNELERERDYWKDLALKATELSYQLIIDN
ncbi:MAG: hypothetical protein AAF363_15685 [Bacteroidota bacterium]